MSYNGWTNYETWCWNLWQDNDAGSYEFIREQAREVYREAKAGKVLSRDEEAVNTLADRMKEEAGEFMPKVEGVWNDLLTAALGEVNWHEIARTLVDEAREEVDEKSDEE